MFFFEKRTKKLFRLYPGGDAALEVLKAFLLLFLQKKKILS
jgi:hypothetical protein